MYRQNSISELKSFILFISIETATASGKAFGNVFSLKPQLFSHSKENEKHWASNFTILASPYKLNEMVK